MVWWSKKSRANGTDTGIEVMGMRQQERHTQAMGTVGSHLFSTLLRTIAGM